MKRYWKRVSEHRDILVLGVWTLLPAAAFIAHNAHELAPHEIAGVLGVALTIGLVSTGVGLLLLRRRLPTVLFATAFLTISLHYNPLQATFHKVFGTAGWVSPVFGVLLLTLLAAAAYGVHRASLQRIRRLSDYLLVLGSILLAIQLFNYGHSVWQNAGVRVAVANNDFTQRIAEVEQPANYAAQPDIYYLIFDRYTGLTGLREGFNYDNTPFLNQLRQRGFFVPENSFANYPVTTTSLASSLNAGELRSTGPIERATTIRPLQELYQQPAVTQYLVNRGYSTVTVGSWWGTTQLNTHSDYDYPNGWKLTLFGKIWRVHSGIGIFVNQTAWRPVLETADAASNSKYFGWDSYGKLHQITFEGQVHDLTTTVPTIPGPKFVFSHMLMPHTPHVYNTDGTPQPEQIDPADGYLRQLEFTNRQILELVDRIRAANSQRPPVIILASDEGEYPKLYTSKATDQQLRQKVSILSAFALPGQAPEAFYEQITPVNHFRALFNTYFDEQFAMQPDVKRTFRNDTKYMHDLVDITARVRPSAVPVAR